jgi:hypothetical protein
MPIQPLSVSPCNSDGMKLIRYFKVVGFLGGLVWLIRLLIGMAVFGGIFILLT